MAGKMIRISGGPKITVMSRLQPRRLAGNETTRAAFIYSGELSFKRSGTVVYPWSAL